MSEKYLYAGLTAGPLASGRWAAPGELIPAADIDTDHDHDKALLEDGAVVETQPAKTDTKGKT